MVTSSHQSAVSAARQESPGDAIISAGSDEALTFSTEALRKEVKMVRLQDSLTKTRIPALRE